VADQSESIDIRKLRQHIAEIGTWEQRLSPVEGEHAREIQQSLLLALEELSEARHQLRRDEGEFSALTAELEAEEVVINTITESTHEQYAYINPAYEFVWVNESFARVRGYTRDSLVGLSYFSCCQHNPQRDDFEKVKTTIQRMTSSAEHIFFPDHASNHPAYWDWTLTPVVAIDKVVKGFVLSLHEVTDRVHTRHMLRQHADRLEILREIDQALLAARSNEELAAAVIERFPGLIPGALCSVVLFNQEKTGSSLVVVQSPGSTQHIQQSDMQRTEAFIARLEKVPLGANSVLKDAQELEQLAGWLPVTGEQDVRILICYPLILRGTLYGALNLGLRDTTGWGKAQQDIVSKLVVQLAVAVRQMHLDAQVRRHAEELEIQVQRRTRALRESQARFRALFEEAAIGVALVNLHGHIVTSNPAMQNMLGYGSDELGNMPFSGLTVAGNGLDPEALFGELVDGQLDFYRTDGRFRRKDGQVIYVNLTFSLVKRYDVDTRYAIVMVEDVTGQKEAQDALIQSEKLALTGKMTAALAHEINNPLQSIIGFLSLALEMVEAGEDQDLVTEYMRIAIDEVKRAANIVTRMRDFNRKSDPDERMPGDINTVLQRVVSLSEKRCEDKGIELTWHAGEDLPEVAMLPDRLEQVFLNLTLNAQDAMPDGGSLAITSMRTSTPEGVQISFQDTGVGIPDDKLPRLFEPFYTTKVTGMGLGLFVSKSIIEEHNGRITVESQLGEGARFQVWLPAHQKTA
jgi:PAS domain S-box-containing protein